MTYVLIACLLAAMIVGSIEVRRLRARIAAVDTSIRLRSLIRPPDSTAAELQSLRAEIEGRTMAISAVVADQAVRLEAVSRAVSGSDYLRGLEAMCTVKN